MYLSIKALPSSLIFLFRLESLRELVSLRRLLVPGNRVGVVEGLPCGLQELHIQYQRLPPGDALVLDPHALGTVQVGDMTLEVQIESVLLTPDTQVRFPRLSYSLERFSTP